MNQRAKSQNIVGVNFLDCTVLLVNRTGVGVIVREILDWMLAKNVQPLACGQRVADVHKMATSTVRPPILFRLAHRLPRVFLILRKVFGWFILPKVGKVFFPDPLYILFYQSCENGTVMVHDLTPLTHPEWHSHAAFVLYKEAYRLIAKSRCFLVPVSQSTCQELERLLHIEQQRMKVVPLFLRSALQSQEVKKKAPQTSAPYFLYVGTLEVRKNVPGLVRGFLASKAFSRGFQLILVGDKGSDSCVVQELVRSQPSVSMRGYVSETELDGLYRDAFGFIYPSFWEGFGLPLLEAMAFGCVCLATHLGASLELISDQRLTFDPYDVNQIKAAFDRVVSMPEEERVLLREQNFQFAQTFSFAKYSKQMDHVLWARGPEITRAQ